MQTLPTVLFAPGEADRILAVILIYHGNIQRLTQPAADGDLVLLAIIASASASAFTIPNRDQALDRHRARGNQSKFFEEPIAVHSPKRKHLPGASHSASNAESDFLSGLIVDKYEDVLVAQTSSLGMDQRKPLIVEALEKIFSPRAIVERNEMASRKFEGLPDANGILDGELTSDVAIQLNGLKFTVDLIGGHKTGCYLDQQVNSGGRQSGLKIRSPSSFRLLYLPRRFCPARGAGGRPCACSGSKPGRYSRGHAKRGSERFE
jgi:23S rRNA (cytosine1962-C5)-methyltransferase